MPVTDDDIIAVARRMLGEDAFAVAWAEGRTMTLEQVTTEVLGSA
jgi:hypothetical protein